ncbi:hypothetical protein HDV01_001852 [Terramyces sp. JEL0728]|nr:hypothetical protein HDV01_001852 [Terramyces sp. JEL0728]
MEILQHCNSSKPNISGTLLSLLISPADYEYDNDLSLLVSGSTASVALENLQVELIIKKLSQYKSVWIAAFPDQYIPSHPNIKFKGDLYQLYLCDKVPNLPELHWKDKEDCYEIKHFTLDTVDYVMQHSTIDYPREYIEKLAVKYSHLTAVIFCNNKPVSWCLTHLDLSIGLMGTVESHRGKGLAKKCAAMVLNHHCEWLKDKIDFFSYCYIKDDNIASSKTMKEGISPKISQQAIFPYLTVFGGFLQLLAGNKDYYLGNSYTACIFTVFGFHWVAKGLIESGIQLIQPVVGQTSDEDRPTVIGMYLLTLTIVNAVFLVISWHHPKSSTLLFFTLLFVTLKMLGETIGAFSGVAVIGQISAWFGVVGSLLALYTFIAEAYAEEGVVLPTGKFNQVITKKQVKQKRD